MSFRSRNPAARLFHDREHGATTCFARCHRCSRGDNLGQRRSHLDDFISAYNSARRLKTLNWLTPYEHICNVWSKPKRFQFDPVHQMPGPNT